MVRGRGRGRGRGRRGKEAQENEQSHQAGEKSSHPKTSSTSKNLPYENSVEPSTFTGLSDPLGQYRMEFDSFCARSMSKVEEPHQIASQPLPHEDAYDNSQPLNNEHLYSSSTFEKSVETSTLTGFSDPLGQYATEFDSFCAESTSKAEGHQQIDSQPPSHENVDGNSQLVSHEHLQKSEAIDVIWSGRSLSNELTEFASGLQETLDEDLFEAASTPDLEYEQVHGHIMKKEISGLVGAIFEKYGDITTESDVRSPESISFFLERICAAYQTLEQTTFFDLTSAEINDMLDELRDLEKQKLNVGWLLQKVEQISETKSSFQNYSRIKREAAESVEFNERIDREIEQYKMHIAVIERKICLAEEEKAANEAKANEYMRMAVDSNAEVKAAANESLVHGLL